MRVDPGKLSGIDAKAGGLEQLRQPAEERKNERQGRQREDEGEFNLCRFGTAHGLDIARSLGLAKDRVRQDRTTFIGSLRATGAPIRDRNRL